MAKSWTRTARIIVGLLVVGFLVVGIFLLDSDEKKAAVVKIETKPVDRGDILRSVSTSGSVRALVMVEVGSQLSGQIAEILVDFNSPVKKDDLIARIDPQTFSVRVTQAEADLKVADANVAVAKASVIRAEASLRRAKLDFERQKPLVIKGTLSETALDAARAAFEISKAELDITKAQIQSAQANTEQRNAALQAALIDLQRTHIRSPIDGVIIERSVDVGQTVAASLSSPTLFQIAQDLRQIQVEANVDEADIGNVKKDNSVTFTVDAFPDLDFNGHVDQVRLAPTELQNVVTYTVIITAKNPELKLLPGMTANVEIVTGKREGVLRVANEALRFRPPETLKQNSSQPPGGSQNRGRGRQALIQRLNKIGVEQEKVERIGIAMAAEISKLRQQMQSGGFDRDRFRQQIRAQRDRLLAEILSTDQMSAYKKSIMSRSESRPGEIWVADTDGLAHPRRIQLGISDDQFTEIISGNIKEGEKAITRMRASKS